MITSTPHYRALLACACILLACERHFVPCAAAFFPAEFPQSNPPAPRGVVLMDAYIAINTTIYTSYSALPEERDRLPVDVDAWPIGRKTESHVITLHDTKVVALCGQYKWGQNWCVEDY